MARKESTIVYDKHVEICAEFLTDEQFGKLMFALIKGTEPDFGDDKMLAMAFAFIALQKDMDDKKYEEKCRKNRENGKKGGRPKKKVDEKPKKANGFFENPNDNENDNENDKDNDDDTGFHHDGSLLHLGSFENVNLTPEEHAALKQHYERPQDLIEKVSVWLRSAKNDVPDHYALCVKFATNDQWPKKKVIEPSEPIVVKDPLDEEEQEQMVAQMRARVNGMFSSS